MWRDDAYHLNTGATTRKYRGETSWVCEIGSCTNTFAFFRAGSGMSWKSIYRTWRRYLSLLCRRKMRVGGRREGGTSVQLR
jgi:hypothetical protein